MGGRLPNRRRPVRTASLNHTCEPASERRSRDEGEPHQLMGEAQQPIAADAANAMKRLAGALDVTVDDLI